MQGAIALCVIVHVLPPRCPADYVADLTVFAEKHALLSAAGDGTLAVVDLRKNKVGAHAALTCMACMCLLGVLTGRHLQMGMQGGYTLAAGPGRTLLRVASGSPVR